MRFTSGPVRSGPVWPTRQSSPKVLPTLCHGAGLSRALLAPNVCLFVAYGSGWSLFPSFSLFPLALVAPVALSFVTTNYKKFQKQRRRLGRHDQDSTGTAQAQHRHSTCTGDVFPAIPPNALARSARSFLPAIATPRRLAFPNRPCLRAVLAGDTCCFVTDRPRSSLRTKRLNLRSFPLVVAFPVSSPLLFSSFLLVFCFHLSRPLSTLYFSRSQHTSCTHPHSLASLTSLTSLRPLPSRAASLCHPSFVSSFWLLAFDFGNSCCSRCRYFAHSAPRTPAIALSTSTRPCKSLEHRITPKTAKLKVPGTKTKHPKHPIHPRLPPITATSELHFSLQTATRYEL